MKISIRMLLLALNAVLASPAASAAEGGGFTFSSGVSASRFSEQSVFGDLETLGLLAETRVVLPSNLYGLMLIRSEDGTSIIDGESAENDYLRVTIEGGLDFKLWLGFTGSVGLNYTQSDLDVNLAIGDTPLTVGISREDYGLRARIARPFFSWAHVSGEIEYSPVDEAVTSIVDVDMRWQRTSPWALALRYSFSPLVNHAALMLRYNYGALPVLAPDSWPIRWPAGWHIRWPWRQEPPPVEKAPATVSPSGNTPADTAPMETAPAPSAPAPQPSQPESSPRTD